jgi:hypothetical protein
MSDRNFFVFVTVMALVRVGSMATSLTDKIMHYVKVDATLTEVEISCYLMAYNHAIVNVGKGKPFLYDCARAPEEARSYGMTWLAIHKHARVTYAFKSPVDGSMHSGQYVDWHVWRNFSVGQRVTIYAHTAKADKSRWD